MSKERHAHEDALNETEFDEPLDAGAASPPSVRRQLRHHLLVRRVDGRLVDVVVPELLLELRLLLAQPLVLVD